VNSLTNEIRQAIEERCEVVLGHRLDHRLRDVVGIVRSKGGRARRTGDAFREGLEKTWPAFTEAIDLGGGAGGWKAQVRSGAVSPGQFARLRDLSCAQRHNDLLAKVSERC